MNFRRGLLHLIIIDKAKIISFWITKGNVADKQEDMLMKQYKDIFGKLFGDKRYIVKESVFEKKFLDGVSFINQNTL